jgi:hypothetical protein
MKKAVAKVLNGIAAFSDESAAELKRRWKSIPPKERAAELTRLRQELKKLKETQVAKRDEITAGIDPERLRKFQESIVEQSSKSAKCQVETKRSNNTQ